MKEVLNTVNPIQTAIRSIFVTFDIGVYSLLKLIYELFFNIATINIIDREMIYTVFSRVQLVIGIFMMFQLVMIVIKGIANPDSATDSKSGGGITVIVRIIVSLSLLALIVPINIPSPKNEYEKQINNNGLLFGTLYSLQYRILANNTMGRLILGDDSGNYTDGSSGSQDLSKFANKFTSTIVRVFYTLNTDEETGKYVCNDGFDATYYQEDVDPNIIIINATEKCGSEHFILKAISHLIDPLQIFQSGKQYRLTMNWLSTVVGIILVVVFFMLTFNVAKRVFKLAALQLIAPIPIISYMDPKGSKDGAFNSWVKLLTTTYLELFIQLGVIYFSFAVINMFIKKFFSVETVTSTVGNAFSGDVVTAPLLIGLTFIVMIIALFIFAKDAPKFLKQALGIKDSGEGFFSAFGNAMGIGAAAAGAIGSFKAGKKASQTAQKTNWDAAANKAKERLAAVNERRAARGLAPLNADEAAKRYANKLGISDPNSAMNKAKYNAAGLANAGLGFFDAANAAYDTKGGVGKKVMAATSAQSDRNSKVLEAGRNGGTTFGAITSLGQEVFTGQNAYEAMEADWKKREQDIKNRQLEIKKEDDINDHYSKIIARVNSKAVTSDKVECTLTQTVFTDKLKDLDYTFTGDFLGGSYIHWDSVSSAAVASGAESFEYEWKDASGTTHKRTIKTADVKQINEVMKDLAADSYLSQAVNNAGFDGEITSHIDSLIEAGVDVGDVKGTQDPTTGKFGMKFNGGGGFKDISGKKSRATTKRKDEINKESEQINRERQDVPGQRAMYNARRFKKGK